MSPLPWLQHLIVVPVLLPLLVGALLIPVNQKRHTLKFAFSLASGVLLWAVAVALLLLADGEHWPDGIGVYLAANWAAPFGIALMVDRLAALMLVLTATIALAVLVFSAQRWDRVGVSFHSLFQFLLMGLNGAFLTNDLFNLFVFFEVMLAASYGLVLHGYNLRRIQAGMQYVAVNLVASLLFLIGVALIYAAAGTLNITDLGGRVATLGAQDAWLLRIGAVVLALAFLTKGAMWPLGFWLPTTYASASAPRQLPARRARLRHLQAGFAHGVDVADADRTLVLPRHREVLAEGAGGERQAQPLCPVRVVGERVDANGLLGAAVVAEVGLPVALEVRRAELERPLHRRLDDAGPPRLARRIFGAKEKRQADLQRVEHSGRFVRQSYPGSVGAGTTTRRGRLVPAQGRSALPCAGAVEVAEGGSAAVIASGRPSPCGRRRRGRCARSRR